METRQRRCLKCRKDLTDVMGIIVFVGGQPTDYLVCVDSRNVFSQAEFAYLVEHYEAGADRWGGLSLDLADSFTNEAGDRVAVIIDDRVSLVVFAYSDQSPQVILYPDSMSAMEAYRRFYADSQK